MRADVNFHFSVGGFAWTTRVRGMEALALLSVLAKLGAPSSSPTTMNWLWAKSKQLPYSAVVIHIPPVGALLGKPLCLDGSNTFPI